MIEFNLWVHLHRQKKKNNNEKKSGTVKILHMLVEWPFIISSAVFKENVKVLLS